MLIKPNSLAASTPVPHELGNKMGPGKYQVKHPEGCDCQMVYSVNHAKWVSYYGMTGKASCAHCGEELDLPMPAIRENWWSKRVLMNLKAIEDDLFRFQLKHEACPPPASEPVCPHLPRPQSD